MANKTLLRIFLKMLLISFLRPIKWNILGKGKKYIINVVYFLLLTVFKKNENLPFISETKGKKTMTVGFANI